MKLSNQLISMPQLSATMRNMSEEMMKVSTRARARHRTLTFFVL